MTTTPSTPGAPITHKRQLVEYLESGCKPPSAWRVGTEHEKFVFRRSDLHRVPYDGPDGIGAVLSEMTRFGWKPVVENGDTIALSNDARCSITLEPGGQFELSGAPLETLHQTCDEVHEHLRQVREVCDELGLGMLGLGFDPKWRREDISWMPKARYRIMRDYMPKKGRCGLDMMLRTCTVQTNLDYQSEADMVKKFRVSLALQPVAVALFANSPFVEGKPSGLLSQRSYIWTDTDPGRGGACARCQRCGSGYCTIRPRSMLPTTSSPTGPRRSARRCAATCRGWHWRHRYVPAPCATWRSKCSISPAKDCIAALAAAPSAKTKRIISTRCSRSPVPAAPRPKNCLKTSAPAGTAQSTQSSPITPIRSSFLLLLEACSPGEFGIEVV